MAALLVVAVYGGLARLIRRDTVGRPFWGLVYYTETVLVIQVVSGIVLLVLGRRLANADVRWLHYLYGSVFPLIALIAGRLYAIRRRDADRAYEYTPVALGGMVAFGLTARALQTADPTIFVRLFGGA